MAQLKKANLSQLSIPKLRLMEAPGTDICQPSLKAVDHIKVYHEVGYAMFIRNVLDAWGFGGENEGEGTIKTKTKKTRVLKGAKLVLVDARSKGVLIS